jgi:outer membrane protein OmpA-like peptidoglycan-associated protein
MKLVALLLAPLIAVVGVDLSRDASLLWPLLNNTRAVTTATTPVATPSAPTVRTEGREPPESDAPWRFDVALVQPKGTSVFAGRSKPNSRVAIYADGELIGFAVTDQNGEWILTTNRDFTNPDPKLTLEENATSQLASQLSGSGDDTLPSSAAGEALLLETLKQHLLTVSASHLDQPAEAAMAFLPRVKREVSGRDVLPVPIQFVFREASFTDDGRKAAQLLLQYLLALKPSLVKMTGHADERGTHEFNMDLSARRLDAVAAFLREGGFKGTMQLTPKGDTEPFAAVDRANTPPEVLYDLDRRVELILEQPPS